MSSDAASHMRAIRDEKRDAAREAQECGHECGNCASFVPYSDAGAGVCGRDNSDRSAGEWCGDWSRRVRNETCRSCVNWTGSGARIRRCALHKAMARAWEWCADWCDGEQVRAL